MGKVNVVIMDTTGSKEQKASLPDDAPVRRIIAKLVQMMALPVTGPDGQPLSYKFHHKASGKQLTDEQTLGEAEVKDGDVLRLQPEITAG
ncbi:MAG: EsaB/YukD family protein [Armatimonadetes bacterium]|nr:EsaB/YukD family protein [Armatimonadota bacterium]